MQEMVGIVVNALRNRVAFCGIAAGINKDARTIECCREFLGCIGAVIAVIVPRQYAFDQACFEHFDRLFDSGEGLRAVECDGLAVSLDLFAAVRP